MPFVRFSYSWTVHWLEQVFAISLNNLVVIEESFTNQWQQNHYVPCIIILLLLYNSSTKFLHAVANQVFTCCFLISRSRGAWWMSKPMPSVVWETENYEF